MNTTHIEPCYQHMGICARRTRSHAHVLNAKLDSHIGGASFETPGTYHTPGSEQGGARACASLFAVVLRSAVVELALRQKRADT